MKDAHNKTTLHNEKITWTICNITTFLNKDMDSSGLKRSKGHTSLDWSGRWSGADTHSYMRIKRYKPHQSIHTMHYIETNVRSSLYFF